MKDFLKELDQWYIDFKKETGTKPNIQEVLKKLKERKKGIKNVR